ncbi:MAG TPA: hypothetical protein PLP07_12360 [Pyrinomonadaceae bacterium]|nr:hypothetical protein [Chloracidobacterium sp.]MBP9936033.1 hypothetical protein [Pyrinomonadaceae bacterium]MBK9768317.1 hypothetical protein [Chloracidobacterium sp.]MBL0239240.1 hypothetical protein [Chloracidobacterium sp.]HQX56715.1 hypothetical protein [Pyrinomonadaceae bacterium]
MIRTLIVFFMIASILLTAQIPLLAQSSTAKLEKKAAKIKAKIAKLGTGEKVKIKVKLYSGTAHRGYLSQTTDDSFVVVDKMGNPNTVKFTDVDSVGGNNLSTGAKIWIGVGIGAGAAVLFLWIFFENYG